MSLNPTALSLLLSGWISCTLISAVSWWFTRSALLPPYSSLGQVIEVEWAFPAKKSSEIFSVDEVIGLHQTQNSMAVLIPDNVLINKPFSILQLYKAGYHPVLVVPSKPTYRASFRITDCMA